MLDGNVCESAFSGRPRTLPDAGKGKGSNLAISSGVHGRISPGIQPPQTFLKIKATTSAASPIPVARLSQGLPASNPSSRRGKPRRAPSLARLRLRCSRAECSITFHRYSALQVKHVVLHAQPPGPLSSRFPRCHRSTRGVRRFLQRLFPARSLPFPGAAYRQ